MSISLDQGVTKMEKLYSQNELREMTGLSDSTLERWRRLGVGPSYLKIGRSVRYAASSVETFFNSMETLLEELSQETQEKYNTEGEHEHGK